MTDVLTPAQVEQRDYDKGAGMLAHIRDQEFARAPAYIPGEGEWGALKEMARALCITEFVPKDMRGRPFAVLGALLTGRDLGIPPTTALRRIPVINGRPSMETAVKVALVRQKGHRVRVLEWDNEHCKVQGWRRGDPVDEVMEVTYSMADAAVAGDTDKDTYKKRPRQMMYARAAGLLCDTYFSDVTLGLPDPDEARDLPPEVIEAHLVAADRRGELPAMPTDTPLTDEEHAAVEEQRLQRGVAAMPPSTAPPPQPRRRGRGPGATPNPQQGADSASPAAAQPEASAAEMARGLGLNDVAERLERGERVPDSGTEWLARQGAAETATTAPDGEAAAAAAPEPEGASGAPAPDAEDPFDGEGAEVVADQLAELRQRAETYADFLMRKKLEKSGKSPASVADLHEQALVALELIAKQMCSCTYAAATADQLQDKLIPWLRQRYATEGGTE